MSAGRKGVSLADLQGVADDGYLTSVRKFLLGEDAPAGPSTVEPVALPQDVFASADVDRDCYGKPADYAHRTTRADVKRLVSAAAKKRLPDADGPLVDYLMFRLSMPDRMRPTRQDAERVARVLRDCYRVEMAGLPVSPGRKPATARMPTKSHTYGECSAVVRRYVNGDVTVGGRTVTADEADMALRTIRVQ